MERAYNFIDISGQRFGKLVAKEYIGRKKDQGYWLCICDCGNMCEKRTCHLKSGASTSCGCYRKIFASNQFKTHGLTKHPLYAIHRGMISRCHNPNSESYKMYGAKGIVVCERWHSFENFYNDVITGYKSGLELDRFPNPRGNYEPSNFRWANKHQQSRNKTDNRFLEFNGERIILEDWGKKLGIDKRVLWCRLKAGWPIEKTLTTPILKTWIRRKKKAVC